MHLPVPAPLTLRLASSADATALIALQRLIYEEGLGFVGDGPPNVEGLMRRLRSLEPEKALFLVAETSDKALAGWLELNRLTPKRLEHVAILTLAIAPFYRRQGLASTLLNRAVEWAEKGQIKKISLNVRGNNRAAITLYEQAGFVLEGRERFHIRLEGGYEDNLIMAKYLGEFSGD